MKSIKQIFSPSQPRPLSSSNSNALPALPEITQSTPLSPATKVSKTRTPLILSGILLLLLAIGGSTALYLSGLNADLRQQAAVDLYPGLGKDCSGFASEGEAYCGSTAVGTCLKCVSGKGVSAGSGSCTGKPCDPNSIFNKPKCGGDPAGSHACASLSDCRVCEEFSPGPGQSPQAKWVSDPGGCGGLACGGPSPTGGTTNGTCPAGIQNGANCSNIGMLGCGGYKTCHSGSGYEACTPTGGNNMCTYRINASTTCTAACPSGPIGNYNMVSCKCNNGVTTIGSLPAGGSCDQLCGCTGNDCPNCKPTTEPPKHITPTTPHTTITPPVTPPVTPPITPPITPIAAQCTNITIHDVDGAELAPGADANLIPGASAVKFSCSANGDIAKYEFRVIHSDGSIETAATNQALTAIGSITGNYVIPVAGKYVVQCRVCASVTALNGTTSLVCQEYEPYAQFAATLPNPTLTGTQVVTSPDVTP